MTLKLLGTAPSGATDATTKAYVDGLKFFYNVKDYGATGDGSTDDATNIQTALDAASSTNAGSTLYFPVGTYKVNSELEIKGSVRIMCAPGATIKRGSSGMQYILKNFNSSYAPTLYGGRGGIVIDGGTWDADGATISAACTVIILAHADGVTIQNITVQNVPDWHGIEVNACRKVAIVNCTLQGFRVVNSGNAIDEAIQLDLAINSGALPGIGAGALDNTPCYDVLVQGCTVRSFGSLGSWGKLVGSHAATDTHPHDNIRIIGNHAENLNDFGVAAYNWDNAVIMGNTFLNCNGGVLWEIPTACTTDIERLSIIGNHFIGSGTINNGASILTNCIETRLTGTGTMRGLTIESNQIKNWANTNAVNINSTSDVVCCSNMIRNGTNGSSVGVIVSNASSGVYNNNKFDTAASFGVRISTSSTDCTVNGNVIITNGTGISIEATRCTVSGNIIRAGLATTNGIKVTSAGVESVIIGNVVRALSGTPSVAGIEVVAATNTLTIIGNVIKGWGTTEGTAGPIHRGGAIAPNISTTGNSTANTNTYA